MEATWLGLRLTRRRIPVLSGEGVEKTGLKMGGEGAGTAADDDNQAIISAVTRCLHLLFDTAGGIRLGKDRRGSLHNPLYRWVLSLFSRDAAIFGQADRRAAVVDNYRLRRCRCHRSPGRNCVSTEGGGTCLAGAESEDKSGKAALAGHPLFWRAAGGSPYLLHIKGQCRSYYHHGYSKRCPVPIPKSGSMEKATGRNRGVSPIDQWVQSSH